MSSAGHIFDVISRMKQNEALKKARRQKRQKVQEAYFKEITHHTKFVDKNKLSDEKLNELKEKIRNDIDFERRRRLTFTLIFITG